MKYINRLQKVFESKKRGINEAHLIIVGDAFVCAVVVWAHKELWLGWESFTGLWGSTGSAAEHHAAYWGPTRRTNGWGTPWVSNRCLGSVREKQRFLQKIRTPPPLNHRFFALLWFGIPEMGLLPGIIRLGASEWPGGSWQVKPSTMYIRKLFDCLPFDSIYLIKTFSNLTTSLLWETALRSKNSDQTCPRNQGCRS